MFEKNVMTLHNRVMAFKNFQKEYYPQMTEENDNGEWEIECRHSITTEYYNARRKFMR